MVYLSQPYKASDGQGMNSACRFVMTVFAYDLSGIMIHPGRNQAGAETVGHRAEHEFGRRGDDQVVRLLLREVPGDDMIEMAVPELADNGIDIVQPVQAGKERLLQPLSVLLPIREVENRFYRRKRQRVQHGARVMAKAEKDKAGGTVRNKYRIVKIVNVHSVFPCLLSIVRVVRA